MKKYLIIFGICTLILGACTQAQAIMLYDDRSAWETAVGTFSSVDIASQVGELATLSAGTPISLPYSETLSFDSDLQRRTVPGSWLTWSGGNTPAIFYTIGSSSVTGNFGSSIASFGLEMEPWKYGLYDMTLNLSGGSSITRQVDGRGGASFFGWDDGTVTSMTLSTTDSAFAFGRMVIGEPGKGPVVPEPASLLLFGTGLVGAFLRKTNS